VDQGLSMLVGNQALSYFNRLKTVNATEGQVNYQVCPEVLECLSEISWYR
jgi:hypothetical protein